MNTSDLTLHKIEAMDSDEKTECIMELGQIVWDGKAQWNKLAAILQADGDNVDAVYAKARAMMANLGNAAATADVEAARAQFPLFDSLHGALDEALLYELERFHKHCDELADMSLDGFIEFKRKAQLNCYSGMTEAMLDKPHSPGPTIWSRSFEWFVKWTGYGAHGE